MSEMVERAARAMALEDNGVDHWDVMSEDGDGHGYVGKNEYQMMARAAIEAMREPTQEMITAAMVQLHPSVDERGVIQQAVDGARLDWQAMIDAALK